MNPAWDSFSFQPVPDPATSAGLLTLLTDSIHATSIVPFASNATFFAMKSFGGYNLLLAAGVAVTGAVLGSAFNWGVGRLVSRLSRRGSPLAEGEGIIFFRRYGIFLLLFSWLPLFNFVSLAAGFLGVRARTALLLVALGQAGYYGWFLAQ